MGFRRRLYKLCALARRLGGINPNRKRNISRKDAKASRFGVISKGFSLRAWRSFDLVQDMLGAINFLEREK